MDSFAPGGINNNCFVVQNVSPEPKTIFIFNYPINYLGTRDLIAIPGVAEDDIRASLLKGELRHKIRMREIIVLCSDIDLLQFNGAQLAFLEGAGITNGLVATGTGGGLTPFEHETLRQLIHFIDEGPGDGFLSGAFKVVLPTGDPFPTEMIWYLDTTMATTLVKKTITYSANHFPTVIEWQMFDYDGVTIVHTVTDTITYSSAFESTRYRTIS